MGGGTWPYEWLHSALQVRGLAAIIRPVTDPRKPSSESPPGMNARRANPQPNTESKPKRVRRIRKQPDESWHDWRFRMHEIIFEADTPGGKLFDVFLLLAISLSVVAVILESVQSIRAVYGDALRYAEWTFTILFTIVTLALIMGTAMYVIEGEENGFTSIPRGLYWAVVTITTVGYGDVSPKTPLGQAVASLAMLPGYSLIIIPTGIFASELVKASRKKPTTQFCPDCSREGHDVDALF